MLEVGSIVGSGKFRIESILGRGGMGVVAVATHLQLEQRVALKVLHDPLAADPAVVERFLREARSSVRLRSEHVCKVSDVGQLEGGAPYIVMELLDGADLAKVIADQPLTSAIAASYILQALIAIAEAHALGIVHRDLKPANLFLTRRFDGSPLVKVLDFGIAKAQAETDFKITSTATVMGSPGYMSPEQLRSARDVDARTDIWALGVILYELVSKRLPFRGETITELAVKVAVDPPDPLEGVSPAYAAIVMRCLEKAPAQRYQRIADLAPELAALAGPEGAARAAVIATIGAPHAPQTAGNADPVAASAATVSTAVSVGNARTEAALGGASTLQTAAGERARRTQAGHRGRWIWIAVGGGLVAAIAALATVSGRTREGSPADRPAPAARSPEPHDAREPLEPSARDAPGPDARTQLRAGIERLAESHDWAAILRVTRELGAPDDVADLIATARAGYLAQQTRAIDTQIHAARCAAARQLAADALAVIPDDASLVARAEACKPKPAPRLEASDANLAYLNEDYREALRIADTIFKSDPTQLGAARIAALAACALHQPKAAAAWASKLDAQDAAQVVIECKSDGVVISVPAR